MIYSLAVSGAPLLCTPVALSLGRIMLPDALVTAIGAAVALFVAHLVYRNVEEPARRSLTRHWLRREPLPS